MAVIVKIEDNEKYLFASINGLGVSDEDKEKAISLNELVKKKLSALVDKLQDSQKGLAVRARNKVEAYWEFGHVLRDIVLESGLVNPSEKKLFWVNVRLHAPEELLAKDRGPNRIHVAYCFRLAGYPKNVAMKREWSEWVYLFDSPFINSEERFDGWDKNKIENEEEYTSRENTRLFIQCLNSMLNDVETNDFSDDELKRCYEGAWRLTKEISGDKKNVESEKFKVKLKKTISLQSNKVASLIDGALSPDEFADAIIQEI